MAIDTPARIAILGAGPIGLEAALYARFLGYAVDLYERGEVADQVRRLGHLPLLAPFHRLSSPLGLAALRAHDPDYRAPSDSDELTGRQWRERYLLPLAATDLLVDHLRTDTTVVQVGRAGVLQDELPGHEDRGDFPFRILLCDADGQERIAEADAVLDTTGVLGQPQWMGEAGIPALGELAAASRFDYQLPDILGAERTRFAGRATLVVGASWLAGLACVQLSSLVETAPATRVFWSTRTAVDEVRDGPVAPVAADDFPQLATLVSSANALAARSDVIQHLPVTAVHAIRWDEPTTQWQVELSGPYPAILAVDQIVSLVGYRPADALFAALPVALSPPTSAVPDCVERYAMRRAAAAAAAGQGLVTSEPHFYVLGAKSFGSASSFRFQDGLAQIRDLFRIIGDRPTLDLYAQTPRLD